MPAEPQTEDDRVADVAARLYGLPPQHVVAARDEEVRGLRTDGEAGAARRVKAFKRPSASAGLVNLLVRSEPALVADVQEVGRRLRAAQDDPDVDPDDRRAIDRERRALLRRCVDAAAELAATDGPPASAASLREVEQTWWAALVDARALAAVRGGTLVRALSPDGFGEVDLSGASAVPPAPVDEAPAPASSAPRPDAHARRAREDARRAADEASTRRRAAEADHRRAQAAASAADSEVDGLREQVADLRDRLAAAEDSLRSATETQRNRHNELRFADRARRAAVAAAEAAAHRSRDHDDD